MSNFTGSADSRETSIEIMDAIEWLADDELGALEIWEAPTEEQIMSVWERVTKNGLIENEFFWGGSVDWANK